MIGSTLERGSYFYLKGGLMRVTIEGLKRWNKLKTKLRSLGYGEVKEDI